MRSNASMMRACRALLADTFARPPGRRPRGRAASRRAYDQMRRHLLRREAAVTDRSGERTNRAAKVTRPGCRAGRTVRVADRRCARPGSVEAGNVHPSRRITLAMSGLASSPTHVGVNRERCQRRADIPSAVAPECPHRSRAGSPSAGAGEKNSHPSIVPERLHSWPATPA